MVTTAFFGRLTATPTVQTIGSGTSLCTVSIAVDDDYWDKKTQKWIERTYFFDLKLWGKIAEKAADKFHKGLMVYVDCKPTQERWEKDGQQHSRVVFEVRHIEDLERFGRKRENGPRQENDYSKTPPAAAAPDYDDDDIPF